MILVSADGATLPRVAGALDERTGIVGTPILEIDDLKIHFATQAGIVQALEGVRLTVEAGECVGLVGETGCGKSATARAVLGFIETPGFPAGGEIRLNGRNVLAMRARALRRIRGREAAYIFQEAKRALDPTATVGSQLGEALRLSKGLRGRAARARSLDLLERVGLPDPERILKAYPHELSGGMAQRVMIAVSIAGEAGLIIADEPTSALDVSIQAQILELLNDLRRETGAAVLLITHDLGVAAENCDRIAVMYAGRVVEEGPVARLFAAPEHPYTRRLLAAYPGPETERLDPIPGSLPDLVAPPPGCRFANRCDRRTALCDTRPDERPAAHGGRVACHHPHGGELS